MPYENRERLETEQAVCEVGGSRTFEICTLVSSVEYRILHFSGVTTDSQQFHWVFNSCEIKRDRNFCTFC